MKLISSSFTQGEPIPKRFTGEGEDISPSLQWSEIPADAKSFALICEDPDAPVQPGKDHPFVHWVVYNIPLNTTFFPEGILQAAQVELPVFIDQGKNSFGNLGYGGPMPPPGHGVHRYHFTLYALNVVPEMPRELTKTKLMQFIKPHVIATSELVGTYERKSQSKQNASISA